MMQAEFADRAKIILEADDNVIGLAVAGSWLTNEIDEFPDLDLILVTKQKVAGDKNAMLTKLSPFGVPSRHTSRNLKNYNNERVRFNFQTKRHQ